MRAPTPAEVKKHIVDNAISKINEELYKGETVINVQLTNQKHIDEVLNFYRAARWEVNYYGHNIFIFQTEKNEEEYREIVEDIESDLFEIDFDLDEDL